MNIRGLPGWVRLWLRSTAEKEGYTYNGRASVRMLLEAIAAGDYELKKKIVDKDDT